MKLPRFLPRAAVVTLLLAAYGAVVFLLSVVLLWGLGSGLRLTFFSDRGPDRSTLRRLRPVQRPTVMDDHRSRCHRAR
jgi:hypothetical protein